MPAAVANRSSYAHAHAHTPTRMYARAHARAHARTQLSRVENFAEQHNGWHAVMD